MKILSLSNKMPYPPKDGGTIGIYNVVDSLANVGNEIHVLAINTPKHFVKESEIPDEVRNKLHLQYVFINTNLNIAGLLKNLFTSKLPYIASRFYHKKFETRLIEILRQESFDVVQLEGLYMATYIETIRKHSNALISLRAHNIEHEIWNRTSESESNILKKWYIKHMVRRILSLKKRVINNYDLLVPVTDRDAEVYNKLGNNRPIEVIAAGFDTSKINIDKRQLKRASLFHLGALDWLPNQEGLLWFINQCLPIIRENKPDIYFNIAGRNAPKWLEKKFGKEGIVYHGEVASSADFMNVHAVMVVPLLSGSGMRIKIIEGMAYGKVIVTTPVGTEGIPSTHRENILIADNEYSFAKEIEKVLNDATLFDTISENAHKFVNENYNRNIIAQIQTEFYTKHCR